MAASERGDFIMKKDAIIDRDGKIRKILMERTEAWIYNCVSGILTQSKPAVLHGCDPEDDYTIAYVSSYLGDLPEGEELTYSVERIAMIEHNETHDTICMLVVTPDHNAIYIYRNPRCEKSFCDAAAKEYEGTQAEIWFES